MKEFWNKRYAQKEYVYGRNVNEFLKQKLRSLKPGKLLLPCDGEGRNAVFAARSGWQVTAFDFSEEAKKKAMRLADEHQIDIDYFIADVNEVELDQKFDVIALVYAHFPPDVRRNFHNKLIKWLKPNGMVLIEAFAKDQLGKPSGGPKNIELLYDEEELEEDLKELKIIESNKTSVTLSEGDYHSGQAEVARAILQLRDQH